MRDCDEKASVVPGAKAVGGRGSWFATIAGERLPCVHQHWIKGAIHFDPGYRAGERQWDDLLAAIEETRKVVVTSDVARVAPDKKNGLAFDRRGYVAVFSVDAIEADDAGLKFQLVQRLTELR